MSYGRRCEIGWDAEFFHSMLEMLRIELCHKPLSFGALKNLCELMPLVILAHRTITCCPGSDEIRSERRNTDSQGTTPVMANQIDRPGLPLELADNPVDVFFLGRFEAVRNGTVETRQSERNNIRSRQSAKYAILNTISIRYAMNEDCRHNSLPFRCFHCQHQMSNYAGLRPWKGLILASRHFRSCSAASVARQDRCPTTQPERCSIPKGILGFA